MSTDDHDSSGVGFFDKLNEAAKKVLGPADRASNSERATQDRAERTRTDHGKAPTEEGTRREERSHGDTPSHDDKGNPIAIHDAEGTPIGSSDNPMNNLGDPITDSDNSTADPGDPIADSEEER